MAGNGEIRNGPTSRERRVVGDEGKADAEAQKGTSEPRNRI